MAIEFKQSSIFGSTGTTGYTAPNGSSRNGRINRVAGIVANSLTALTGSRYLICQIPSSAIMLPESAIKTTGWGFAQATIGTPDLLTGLLDVAKATGGTTGNKPITIFGATWNKPIWQQLGLAADPGHPVDLVVSTATDATVAGQIDFDLVFANHI